MLQPQPSLQGWAADCYDLCISSVPHPICFRPFHLPAPVPLVGPTHTETTTRLDAIVGGGTLRVGMNDDYRPFSFADVSGKVEGIDVDMAMSLAQSLGVRLEVVKTSWSAFKSDLGRNSFDIAMSQVCSRTVDD
jgi:ABC-type amino acid transport substrate-binding protein